VISLKNFQTFSHHPPEDHTGRTLRFSLFSPLFGRKAKFRNEQHSYEASLPASIFRQKGDFLLQTVMGTFLLQITLDDIHR
jgi:hypothetical protein